MGQRIHCLAQLIDARRARRAVVCPSWVGFVKPKPAAVVLNLNGEILYRMMMRGLYLYEKENAKGRPTCQTQRSK